MTVSQITNVTPEIKRAQENQNRAAEKLQAKNLPQTATLPKDSVAESAQAALRGAGLDDAAARQATEVQNHEAAASTLSDDDVEAVREDSAQHKIQEQRHAALRAQTNKLSGNVLQLLNE